MSISRKIDDFMNQASWIRKMFEEGKRMKEELGADQVFDFSLGNPIMEPPQLCLETLRGLILNPPEGLHRYMPNAGHPHVRAQVAHYLSQDTGTQVDAQDIIMTCGAGGALNAALKALLDPGDEVAVVAPYFPEYRFYVDNHGGIMQAAQSTEDFDLDLSELDRVIGSRTKAIILNSPNNPTGRVYSAERLCELRDLLSQKEQLANHPITILSDEPYRKIVYDGLKTPSSLAAHPNTVLITSHSKDLGLPGERIGFAAICPHHHDRASLRRAMTFTNRTLGFVNAPALFQHVVAKAQAASVSVETYQKLRDLFCVGLSEAGIEVLRPQGAFYLFPKAPTDDDIAFVRALKNQNILAVPGSGFARSGYFRLSFCVNLREIQSSLPGFKKTAAQFNPDVRQATPLTP